MWPDVEGGFEIQLVLEPVVACVKLCDIAVSQRLGSVALSGLRTVSQRTAMPASARPCATACTRRARHRASPASGMSLRPSLRVSRYAQMTSESKSGGRPPGRSSTGTLPSGFSRKDLGVALGGAGLVMLHFDPVREARFVREHERFSSVRRVSLVQKLHGGAC